MQIGESWKMLAGSILRKKQEIFPKRFRCFSKFQCKKTHLHKASFSFSDLDVMFPEYPA